VVLGNTPNTFPGLETIGKVVYILNLVMFVLFNGLMITRFILVPRKLTTSLHHPVEGLFHGTYWVSVALILNGAYVFGKSETGSWMTKAHEVCFWTYCGISFTISIIQYSMFFRLERLNVTDAVPAWIFPIYPLLVVGTLAGTILPSQPNSASWKIFHGGVLFQGVSWLISFLMYGIYMQRLMTSSLPSPNVRPGMYVSVGPAGTNHRAFSSYDLLTILSLHFCWVFVAFEAGSASYTSQLLDGHRRSRRRDRSYNRHHGRPIHPPLRLLVLFHHNRRYHNRYPQDVLFPYLVGIHIPQRRTLPRNHSGRQGLEQRRY
jgi:tellurite resistance protein TehA-like permease